jgi:hypothetical protein
MNGNLSDARKLISDRKYESAYELLQNILVDASDDEFRIMFLK